MRNILISFRRFSRRSWAWVSLLWPGVFLLHAPSAALLSALPAARGHRARGARSPAVRAGRERRADPSEGLAAGACRPRGGTAAGGGACALTPAGLGGDTCGPECGTAAGVTWSSRAVSMRSGGCASCVTWSSQGGTAPRSRACAVALLRGVLPPCGEQPVLQGGSRGHLSRDGRAGPARAGLRCPGAAWVVRRWRSRALAVAAAALKEQSCKVSRLELGSKKKEPEIAASGKTGNWEEWDKN